MTPERLDQELTDQDRVLLVFAYLGPLALVSLLATRREFVKWHAKQGLVLTAVLFVVYPILRAVQFLLASLWDVFGELFRMAVWLGVSGIGMAALVCLVRALEGERLKLPVLGELADRL